MIWSSQWWFFSSKLSTFIYKLGRRGWAPGLLVLNICISCCPRTNNKGPLSHACKACWPGRVQCFSDRERETVEREDWGEGGGRLRKKEKEIKGLWKWQFKEQSLQISSIPKVKGLLRGEDEQVEVLQLFQGLSLLFMRVVLGRLRRGRRGEGRLRVGEGEGGRESPWEGDWGRLRRKEREIKGLWKRQFKEQSLYKYHQFPK